MSDVGVVPMPEGAARRVEEAKREAEESGLEKSMSGVQVERRMSGVEMERRMSIMEVERRMSVEDRRMSIVEHVRMVTDAQLSATEPERKTIDVPDAKAELRRGSIPMPGSWISEPAQEEDKSVVVSDSPKIQSNDMLVEASESSEPLTVEDLKASTPIVVGQSVENSAASSVAPTSTSTPAPVSTSTPASSTSAPAPPRSPKQTPAEALRSSELGSRKGLTPPTNTVFQHIWPTPPIPSPGESSSSKKGRRLKYDVESAPSRSFITRPNLPSTPTGLVMAQPTKSTLR